MNNEPECSHEFCVLEKTDLEPVLCYKIGFVKTNYLQADRIRVVAQCILRCGMSGHHQLEAILD